ncbi:MAG: DUF4160 domain-containing protein [Candidatus Alectryocaccobium sp.]|jgi:hypothetical protein|nr:DUF4160 domain-containing protein [Candidatus Alectryocaccobium sp.]
MPQIFKIGPYLIYFWANEGNPLEPIHVHIAEGKPVENATKLWITQSGKCLLQNNNSHIPDKRLKLLIRIIEANSEEIINKWKAFFEKVYYFC